MSDIKFIQIAVSDDDGSGTIIALSEDGNVYEYLGKKGWFRLEGDEHRSEEAAPDEPEEEEEEESPDSEEEDDD